MDPLLTDMFSKDTERNFVAINSILENTNSDQIINCAYNLLMQGRFFEAYVIFKSFDKIKNSGTIISLTQAIGGLVFGNRADETEGVKRLWAGLDALDPARQDMFAKKVLHPIMTHLTTSRLMSSNAMALRILDVYKAGFMEFREIFDDVAPAPVLDSNAFQSMNSKPSKLIKFQGPPEGAATRPVRTVVAMRDLVFPQNPKSRTQDHLFRMSNAMSEYGWAVTSVPMKFLNVFDDYNAIISACENSDAELLIIDDLYILQQTNLKIRETFIHSLRTKLPGVKIVSWLFDPWEIDDQTIINTAKDLDAVWSCFPSMKVWEDPSLKSKTIFVLVPHAGYSGSPTTPLGETMSFVGSVAGYNWHRGFWKATADLGIPLEIDLSPHSDDGLSVKDSYFAYMKRLESGSCTLNFSMRPNLARTFTGRCAEAIISGALLIQESTEDMDYYFEAGKHYMSFGTLTELRSISNFIIQDKIGAEKIRTAGNEYANQHYTDYKLVSYLDRAIFH